MNDDQRFWSKVAVRGAHECWLWTGPLNNKGYGRFATYPTGQKPKRLLAHRHAMRLSGRLIEDLVVRHTCDNPPCCNPNHMVMGTQAENLQDCRDRGRFDQSGLAAGRVRSLTDEQVREIVRLTLEEGWSCRELAENFGVIPQVIRLIWYGRTYKWVTTEEQRRLMKRTRVAA